MCIPSHVFCPKCNEYVSYDLIDIEEGSLWNCTRCSSTLICEEIKYLPSAFDVNQKRYLCSCAVPFFKIFKLKVINNER